MDTAIFVSGLKDMRQILCVIDLTESAAKVLEVAVRIANACKAHLIVLLPYRLISNRGYQGDIPSLKRKLETEANEKFEELKKKIPGVENVSWEFVSEIGFISDRIESNVRRKKVDIVIISQQQNDASDDRKSFNLQALIADSKLPFVVVPPEVNIEANV